MTPHISAQNGEIAKTVLMPGDPLRAKYIAENFLENAKLVSSIRNIFAYTGTYKGKEVSVMASGMGNPSMGIYSYELYKFYNVENIIRIGTAGSYKEEIGLQEVILAEKTYSKSTYAIIQSGMNEEEIEASKYLNGKIEDTARKENIKIYKGTVLCSDVFYTENEKYEEVEEHNCLAVEMESFALFANAKALNKNASCILTVSNMSKKFKNAKELTAKERETLLNKMITLALETSIEL